MHLDPIVESITRQLAIAANAGDDASRDAAQRLIPALESALRLGLLEALSTAADELTLELAPGSVEVRLRGGEPTFVLTQAPSVDATTPPPVTAAEPTLGEPDLEPGPSSRINLRLPDALKARVEEAAAREGRSVNAWLVRAASAALTARTPDPTAGTRTRQRMSGWVR
jgi:hypothetical protein